MNGFTFGPPQGQTATAIDPASYPLLAPDGLASAPSYSFASDPDTGLYWSSSNTFRAAFGGTARIQFGQVTVFGSSATFGWSSSSTDPTSANNDTVFIRQAAGSVGLHNSTSTSAQLSIFNTFTNASNYESLESFWSSSTAIIRTAAAGSGAARDLQLRFGGTAVAGIIIGTGTSGGVKFSTNAVAAAVTNRVTIADGADITATSGTHTDFLLNGDPVPSSSSTMDYRYMVVGGTINYASGGAGRVQLLRLSPTNTALPTGPSAAIVLSATASALGGIQLHNQSDETTNSESATLSYSSNVLTLSSTAAGSGTVRNINLSVANAAGSAVVLHSATSTITGGVTDGYTAGLRLTPTYNAATAQTVTRHNYIDLNDAVLGGAGPAALTAAAVFRLDAALGTHKATTNTDKTGNAKSGTLIVNVAGTLYHIQLYAT